jgi:Mg/Co/Ni transporter MgtE
MDVTHSTKEKRSFKSQFKEAMVFLAIIVGVIAFSISAAVYGFDPSKVFITVFGAIALVMAVAAIGGVVLLVVIRLFNWLFK